MGDLRLYQIAEAVQDVQADFVKEIIGDMYDTMLKNLGAGLAAPQIGFNYRIIIFGVPTPRYADINDVPPETVLINPEVTVLTQETESYWEACLSVPTLRGLVARPTHIAYRGYDPQGRLIEREATGFHARVVQHEMDHLNGILFPFHIKDMRLLAFEDQEAFQELKQRVREGEFI